MEDTRRRAISVGSVVGRSFSIWRRNLVPFTILSVIVYSPHLLYAFLSLGGRRQAADAGNVGTSGYSAGSKVPAQDTQISDLAWAAGGWLLGTVLTSALIYAVLEQLRGQRVGILACLRIGLSRLVPVVCVAISVGVIVGGAAIPFVILIAVARDLALPLMIVFGFIAVILLSRYWLAVPVAVVERPGVVASLKRSAELTRGALVPVFLILFVLYALQFVAGLAIGLAAPTPGAVDWGTLTVSILFGPVVAVANAVAYHDLRVSKEGVGIDDLVRVFA